MTGIHYILKYIQIGNGYFKLYLNCIVNQLWFNRTERYIVLNDSQRHIFN